MKNRTSSAFSDAINILAISKFLQKSTYQHDISRIKEALLKDFYSRTDQDIQSLYEFIYIYSYIQRLKTKYSEAFVKEICRYLHYKQVSQNTIINTHKTVFLVLSGRVLITQQDEIEGNHKNGSQELTFGMSFNDYGLSENKHFHARAIRPTEFACLDFKIFHEVSTNQRSSETYEKQKLIRSLQFFSIFSDVEVKYFSYHMDQSLVSKHSNIYQEQDKSLEFCYFIARGEMQVQKSNSEGKLFGLTTLTQGEFFGEEGFFQVECRQFTVQCVQDNTLLYRIALIEFDKRVWKKEHRKILFDLLSQRWIYRFQRFCELSQTSYDKDLIMSHIENLSKKLLPSDPIKIDMTYTQGQINEDQQSLKTDMFVSASWLMKSANEAQKFLANFKQKPQEIKEANKITSVSPRFKLQLERIKEKELKEKKSNNQNRSSSRNKNLRTNQSPPLRVSSFHSRGKVTSNMSYLKIFGNQSERLNLEQQLTNYLQKLDVNNDDIYWGGCNSTERQSRIDNFYSTMSNYAQTQHFKNVNLQESKSQHAKQLDMEYQQLLNNQQANIKKAFDQMTVRKTDNMLKKEFFLNKLKKMQKRLKVLELVQKGQLICKPNQIVNEDADIVDKDDEDKPDDAYDIVNGKKVRKFNFVTSDVYDQFEKNKYYDVENQIDQQKKCIQVIREIVTGKLPVSAANEDIKRGLNSVYRPSSSVKQKIPLYLLQTKTENSKKQTLTQSLVTTTQFKQ